MAEIFVFGSNLAGRHGKGSARAAFLHHGAVYGVGVGRQGRAYAIPTKDGRDELSLRPAYQILSLTQIQCYVEDFLQYAKICPEDTFNVVAIGCSNSGYKPEQIGPMFKNAPPNVNLPEEFKPYV